MERIVTDDQVENAILAMLRNWVPFYLADVEEQVGLERGYYERPVESSYIVRDDFDKWPEEMLPCVVVVSLGPIDQPVKDGRWSFRTNWLIGVLGVASGLDQVSSRRAAYHLGGAIRAALAGRQTLDRALDETVRGVQWQGGRNGEMPGDGDRTVWAQRQAFSVEVGDVLTQGTGPAVLPPDPIEPVPPSPTIETASDVSFVLTPDDEPWRQEP